MEAKPAEQRTVIAERINAIDVDLLWVKEVEDIGTLRNFHRARSHAEGGAFKSLPSAPARAAGGSPRRTSTARDVVELADLDRQRASSFVAEAIGDDLARTVEAATRQEDLTAVRRPDGEHVSRGRE